MKVWRIIFLLSLLGFGRTNCFALDRDAFTFTHYNLDVRIEPQQQRLAVRGSITLRNDSPVRQKNAVLQISSSLGWRSIQISGKPVQFVSQPYTSDIDHTGSLSEAIVSLPQEVPPKGSMELEVGYEGTVALDTTRLTRVGVPSEVAKHSDWDQISPTFTALRGVGYVAWYPVAMEAANLSESNSVSEMLGRWKAREQASSMRLRISNEDTKRSPTSLPGPDAVNADARTENCPVEQEEKTDTSFSTANGGPYRFCCQIFTYSPLWLRVPTLVANYAVGGGGSPSAVLLLLGDSMPITQAYLRAISDVQVGLSTWFGDKKAVFIYQLPEGDESFESGASIMTPSPTDDPQLLRLILAHTVAHADFRSPRPWVYEGLAHFAQALWREEQAGRQAALDYMGLHRSAIAQAEKAQEPKSVQSLATTTDEEFYRSKAMFVWWMLRDMIGDTALKQALRAYRAEDDKDTSYVQRLIEASGKRELQWFFDDWVYHDKGLPDFRVASIYPRAMEGGGYVVTVSVENLAAAGAEVPISVQFQGGQVTKRLEVRGKSTASIRLEVPSKPEEALVNDGSVPESDLSNNAFRIELMK